MIEIYASKLGILHSCTTIRRKAKEYMHTLEMRGGWSTLNVSSSCMIVVCLELAATGESHNVDRVTSVRLSGVTKRAYVGAYKAVETMLNLTQVTSVKDLTVQFGCTPVQTLAEKILDRYEEEHRTESEGGVNFGATMFKCAAISVACKINKIRVERRKLYEMSAVKRGTFESLTSEMERLAQRFLGAETPKSKQKTGSQSLMDKVYANMQENDPSLANRPSSDSPAVDFDEWKRRILAQAT